MFASNNMGNSRVITTLITFLLTPAGTDGIFVLIQLSRKLLTLGCAACFEHIVFNRNCDELQFSINRYEVHLITGAPGKSQTRVPTAGEELQPDGSDQLALQGLWEGALGVLDGDVPVLDPPQQPQQVAVTQQVRRLELPVKDQEEHRPISRPQKTTLTFNVPRNLCR